MELWDDAGAGPYYGALLAFDGTYYEAQIGERRVTVSPRDLRDNWFGTYVLLWQTPPDYHGSLRLGDAHPSVRWLHEQLLALLPESNLGPPKTAFDEDLAEAVIAFQQQEGLLADGIVGPMTWIRLGDRLNLPAPKLQN